MPRLVFTGRRLTARTRTRPGLTNAVQTANLSAAKVLAHREHGPPLPGRDKQHERREEHVKHVSRKVIAVGLVAAVAALAVAVAVATAGTSGKKASIQVCVLLPDTSSS